MFTDHLKYFILFCSDDWGNYSKPQKAKGAMCQILWYLVVRIGDYKQLKLLPCAKDELLIRILSVFSVHEVLTGSHINHRGCLSLQNYGRVN